MIAMFKLFYNTIAACQRPVGPLLSNKCMYVSNNVLIKVTLSRQRHCRGTVYIKLKRKKERKEKQNNRIADSQ